MTSKQIRQDFLDFFRGKGHAIVPSSPVVPFDDPTLMFTNAGMNQFKDVFLGTGSRAYKRAANTQKCIRAGGKHNDLDDVGQDTYHHTFFEMLGNWSFGDYFKKEAIAWAWELLTKVWGIDKSRLHATYFGGLRKTATEPRSHEATERDPPEPPLSKGGGEWEVEPDYEARDLWASVTDIDPTHIHPGSMKDNFWEMGETGPCGPCSEIHIDLTPDKSGGCLVNKGDARVMEIWNLVFIQFNRGGDGKLTPLPAKHVDTGMGFERLCAVLQGTRQNRMGQVTNYDTDVFAPLFDAIRKRTAAPAYQGTLPSPPGDSGEVKSEKLEDRNRIAKSPNRQIAKSDDQILVDVSYRVIADHVRCLTFALTDGAIPSNEGRGYVLRRILRRAVRYGRQYMNMHEPFLCDLVAPLVEHMAEAFPELRTAHRGKNVEHVTALIREEEASFLKTLDRGIRLFNEAAEHATKHHHGRIKGEDAFKLHDTYGFPIDLTELMAEEQGLTIDVGEYERLMETARERARAGDAIADDRADRERQDRALESHAEHHEEVVKKVLEDDSVRKRVFLGECPDEFKFDHWRSLDTYIVGLGPKWVTPNESLADKQGERTQVTTATTCFYAEQGGQVSDRGWIQTDTGRIDVDRVVRRKTELRGRTWDLVLHEGRVTQGGIQSGQVCRMQINESHRIPTMQNHTATHILNWALREVLEIAGGGKVDQKGSLVDPEKTRFDFSHNKPLTGDELDRIEKLCNEHIAKGLRVYAANREADFVDQKQAREINTLRAVFGEKYPDRVRAVSIGAPITEEDAKQAGES
ncbi:MAG: alanine--tRNA ligase, partial [Phycisphaerales bacterium]|nr:alanine--tRNA ligase [Phycisphaerales bacterium]